MSDRYGRKPVIYAGCCSRSEASLRFCGKYLLDHCWARNSGCRRDQRRRDGTDGRPDARGSATRHGDIGIHWDYLSISLVLAPVLYQAIDVPGIFVLTGALALLAVLFVAYLIPNPAISRFHSGSGASRRQFGEVLRNRDLLRLDFGIFSLHAILMSVFMQVPFVLKNNGLDVAHHWQVYLPVMLLAFVLMVLPIIVAEKRPK